jgi:Arc/MetJ family transcription regulator
VAKNAAQTVTALLAKAPAPPARTQQPQDIPVEPPPEAEPERDQARERAPEPAASTAPAAPAARPAARRRSEKPADPAPSSASSKAPPTLRLAQPTAEALRTAWLKEKRDRVLLTYQDFAGEVITAGLRGGYSGIGTVDDKPASTANSPVPRTLRLAQPTAEALRTAWLKEKRDRVLLTYQDFAGEVITAGLPANARRAHIS